MENINLYNSICFTASKINKYRKNSLAQKIRRDLLRLIIYKPKKEAEIKILKKQIEDLTSKKFNNISELILFDFQNNFVNYLNKQNKAKKFKLNPTSKALELIDLFEKINNSFLSIYIHGSHADGYTTNFSDLDVSIFISNQRSTFDFEKIKNDILILNNCVKKFDLESHHSIFLNLTNDLNCYPESIMPLDVLGQSLISKNQKTISAQTRFSIDIAIDTFLRIYSSINKISPENNNNNFYNIKFIIFSYFMLIILKYEILN